MKPAPTQVCTVPPLKRTGQPLLCFCEQNSLSGALQDSQKPRDMVALGLEISEHFDTPVYSG